MKKLIKVTKEDIYNGKKSTAAACPISLACNRALKDHEFNRPFRGAYVVPSGIFLLGIEKSYKTAKSAVRFMRAFDNGKKVKPFNFILNMSPENEV